MDDFIEASRRPIRVEQELKALREDFERTVGEPFRYFFCPILFVDEYVPLCMGHVVNESIPDSYRGAVVQRRDVDNFYGTFVEADFSARIRAMSMSPEDLLTNPTLSKVMESGITTGGHRLKHYLDRGANYPHHSRVRIDLGGKATLHWVVANSPEEVESWEGKELTLLIAKDCRLPALVSLLKSAHLTLFKLLGYSYALSAAGYELGYEVLGRFYREHGGKGRGRRRAALKSAPAYFQKYINLMRVITNVGDGVSFGTAEDRRARICIHGDRPFAFIINVRAGDRLFAVLSPGFNDEAGAVAYYRFLTTDDTSLVAHNCVLEPDRILVSKIPKTVFWPKNDMSFGFQ